MKIYIKKEPLVVWGLNNKGIFHGAQIKSVVVKDGSDSLVGVEGLNQELVLDRAGQFGVLKANNIHATWVVSGVVKEEKRRAGLNNNFTDQQYGLRGFNRYMGSIAAIMEGLGLHVVTLGITGYDLTEQGLKRYERLLLNHKEAVTFLVNGHDGLNTDKSRFDKEAANNDIVGEKFAMLHDDCDTYIICTNVDGVLARSRRLIKVFDNLNILDEIEFTGRSENGKGGMETKLWSLIRFAQSRRGRRGFVVNAREQNILTRILLDNEEIGTKVQFS